MYTRFLFSKRCRRNGAIALGVCTSVSYNYCQIIEILFAFNFSTAGRVIVICNEILCTHTFRAL